MPAAQFNKLPDKGCRWAAEMFPLRYFEDVHMNAAFVCHASSPSQGMTNKRCMKLHEAKDVAPPVNPSFMSQLSRHYSGVSFS